MSLSKELRYQKGIAKALNVLGDIYFLRNELAQSKENYQEAIELSRSIDNKPVLGMSLVEQGFVTVKLKDVAYAKIILEEVKEIVNTLDNPDLRFRSKVLESQVMVLQDKKEVAIALLEAQLSIVLTIEEEATIQYELFKLKPSGNIHQQKAFELYESLFKKIPKFLFKQRIDELNPNT